MRAAHMWFTALVAPALLLAGCANPPSTSGISNMLMGPCNLPVGYANPIWSPDGTQIVFNSFVSSGYAHDISIMDASGGNVRRLSTGHLDLLGSWSPDPGGAGSGKHIAFSSDREGGQRIFVMDADGRSPTRLVAENVQGVGPVWSPDGKRIAFGTQNSMVREVYVVNSDGTGLTRLAVDSYLDGAQVWSPDSRRIVYVMERDGNPEIYVANVDPGPGGSGSGGTRLTSNETINTSPIRDVSPAWSPDGKRIAFQSNRDGHQAIYIMDVDGKNQTELTTEGAGDYAPAWSPDPGGVGSGKRIAFVSNRDGNQEIYVMAADGSNQTRLTNSPRDDNAPAWSPDGKRFVFTSWRDNNSDIFVMNSDGSAVAQLTINPAKQRCFKWPF